LTEDDPDFIEGESNTKICTIQVTFKTGWGIDRDNAFFVKVYRGNEYCQAFRLSMCFVLLLLTIADAGGNKAEHRPNLSSMFESNSTLVCLSKDEIALALQNLSSAKTSSEQEHIKNSLLDNAKRSNVCRNRIIAVLMEAMDQPDVDLVSDRSTFYLWHYGTELLGDLKAVEALDLLIKHLDLNDGTPFPLHHHPALVGVITMGPVAIPKLKDVLRESTDRYMRRYAVFCIASIGGTSARQALEDALPSESDECVRGFLQASIQAFSNREAPNKVGADENSKWYSAFLCDGS
jgi:hypothetical protein